MKFIFLSPEFYADYANCPQLLQKQYRPYAMVPVKINGRLFAVPLRSNVNHKYVLWTDRENHCGLDFSKAVVITKRSYISQTAPHIRQNEFNSLRGKEHEVDRRMRQYINDYKKACQRLDVPRNQILHDRSTLQYFNGLF